MIIIVYCFSIIPDEALNVCMYGCSERIKQLFSILLFHGLFIDMSYILAYEQIRYFLFINML